MNRSATKLACKLDNNHAWGFPVKRINPFSSTKSPLSKLDGSTSKPLAPSPLNSSTAKGVRSPVVPSPNTQVNFGSPSASSAGAKRSPNPAVVVTDYDAKPGYKPMTSQLPFKGKTQEFAGVLNPFKPASDVKVGGGMDSSLNNSTGRVAGTMTGQTTKPGVSNGFNQYADTMRPGDSLSLGKTKQTSVEGRASMSMVDLAVPGLSTTSGVHVGPSAWVSANYTHAKTNELNLQKLDDNSSKLQGSNLTSHQGTVGAFGGAKVGVEAGPMTFGPLAGVTGTAGVKHTNTSTSTLAPNHQPGAEFANFAENGGKTKFSGDQWVDNNVKKDVTYPASLKGEITATGTTPYYGGNDRLANTGAFSAIAGYEVDDLRHPRQSSNFVAQSSGQLYSDGFLKSNDGASNGEVSRLDFQRPVEHAVDLPTSSGKDGALHGSRWNHPLGPNVSQLDKQLGPGMADFSVKEFRNQFGDNVPQRDMTFHRETLDDGRMRVSGQFNPKVADGYNVAVPGVSHSNTVKGEMNLTRPLYETAVPVDTDKV